MSIDTLFDLVKFVTVSLIELHTQMERIDTILAFQLVRPAARKSHDY